MFGKTVLCCFLSINNWLQNHLIPCPFKKLTGIDCPGCGFQRSMVAFIKGDIEESFHLYPAAIPLILTSLFVAFSVKLNIDNRHIIKKTAFIITGSLVMASYLYKIYRQFA